MSESNGKEYSKNKKNTNSKMLLFVFKWAKYFTRGSVQAIHESYCKLCTVNFYISIKFIKVSKINRIFLVAIVLEVL